jgi:hypothetical protein
MFLHPPPQKTQQNKKTKQKTQQFKWDLWIPSPSQPPKYWNYKNVPKCWLFFFFVTLGFELRTLHLQSRCYTAWVTPLVLWTICLGWP